MKNEQEGERTKEKNVKHWKLEILSIVKFCWKSAKNHFTKCFFFLLGALSPPRAGSVLSNTSPLLTDKIDSKLDFVIKTYWNKVITKGGERKKWKVLYNKTSGGVSSEFERGSPQKRRLRKFDSVSLLLQLEPSLKQGIRSGTKFCEFFFKQFPSHWKKM